MKLSRANLNFINLKSAPWVIQLLAALYIIFVTQVSQPAHAWKSGNQEIPS